MATLFISDLHLSGQRPAIIHLFLEFLKQEAVKADALYILGDLFEAWIGDDYIEDAVVPIMDAFAALTQGGLPIFVMAGNRDFLLGQQFEQQTGCQLLADESVIDLYGTPTLLMHGDTLCTDDVDYQQLRKRFRDPAWQKEFLALPTEQRLTMASNAREESSKATSAKSEIIMDVNNEAVINVFSTHQVTRLIHGHTHRPNTHTLHHDGQEFTRIVLGDWYQQGSVLRCDHTGCTLSSIPITDIPIAE